MLSELPFLTEKLTGRGSLTNKFAVKWNGIPRNFDGLAEDLRDKILNTKLLVYICDGTESEIREWFENINIA